MCREILNTCVRNTEEAERASRTEEGGRRSGKGVWGMIEESKLAKSIRLDEEKKVSSTSSTSLCDAHAISKTETDIVVRARLYVTQLTAITDPQPPVTTPQPPVQDVVSKARSMVRELASVIQETEDPIRLEELLGINDQLLTMLKKVPIKLKETLKLHGLGLSVDNGSNTTIEADGKLDGYPHLNGGLNGHTRVSRIVLRMQQY
jgi:protein phosphatase 1 regulatory subunit 37